MKKPPFFGSTLFTIASIIAAYFIDGWSAVLLVCMLGILEVSLSFDNAIINAKEIEKMSALWRQRFLTWGMVIAVFGMRIIFPIIIVQVVSHIGFLEVLNLALYEPDTYAHYLEQSHIAISSFGATFLMMVFLKYFLDVEKQIHRIGMIEHTLARWGKVESIESALVLIGLLIIAQMLPTAEASVFLMAGIAGLITYLAVQSLNQYLQEFEQRRAAVSVSHAGLGTFLYLEVLDASFSFDGVIGAFALSKNIFIIALGLGIGAMFVRSLTIYLVEKKTLSSFRYLEHGAFWAIGALALMMYLSTLFQVPELLTGSISAVLIIASLGHSLWWRRKL